MSCSTESRAFWANPANTTRLRALWEAGVLPTEIALRMGLSRGAVVGRIWRLKLALPPGRRSRRKPAGGGVGAVSVPHVRKPQAATVAPIAIPTPEPRLLAVSAMPITPARGGRVVECSFVTATSGRTHSFCNAPSVPGSAWCAQHRRQCIVVPHQKTNFGAST